MCAVWRAKALENEHCKLRGRLESPKLMSLQEGSGGPTPEGHNSPRALRGNSLLKRVPRGLSRGLFEGVCQALRGSARVPWEAF